MSASSLPWLLLAVLALPVSAQVVTMTASGTLSTSSSLSPTVTSAAVNGSAVFSTGFGTATLTVGAPTTLVLTAIGPPSPSTGWAMAMCDLVLEVSSTVPVAGVLRFTLPANCPSPAPDFVDVEDDGVLELFQYGGTGTPFDVPVVLGSGPVVVRFGACSFSPLFNCTRNVSIDFVPQPTNLQSLLPPCGPDASASLRAPTTSPGLLRVRLGNMNGLAGAFFVGTVPTGPSTVCGPSSNADVSILIAPDPAGVTIDVPLLPALIGVYHLQYVELTLPFQLWWSNAVQLTLP